MKSQINIWLFYFLFILLWVSEIFPSSVALCQSLRPLAVDDYYRLEEIGEATLSPNGEWLAYVVRRPRLTLKNYMQDGDVRSDIWLVSTGGGKPSRITNGHLDSTGFWHPVWSPDGNRLALLSSRGKGNHIRVWVWEKSSGTFRRITEQSIADEMGGGLVWVSNNSIICGVLPEGQEQYAIVRGIRSARIAMNEWPKSWKGQEPTASILESGVSSYENRAKGKLLLIDVMTGSQQVLFTDNVGPPNLPFGRGANLSLSPDSQYMAFVKWSGKIRPVGHKQLRWGHLQDRYQLGVIALPTRKVAYITPVALNVLRGTYSWSPDGREIAFVALDGDFADASRRVFKYRLGESSVREVSPRDIDIFATAEWGQGGVTPPIFSSAGTLLFFGTQKKSSESTRAEWYAMASDSTLMNLTSKMRSVPRRLIPEQNRDSFVFLSSGELWRIDVSGVNPTVEKITSKEGKVRSIVLPLVDEVIVGVGRTEEISLLKIELSSGKASAFSSQPDPGANLVGYNNQKEVAVFTAQTRKGTYLWLLRPDTQKPQTVAETNFFVREIANPQMRKIEYRSLDGQQLKGWIMLPSNYQSGKKYPLVAYVYPGRMYGDELTVWTRGGPYSLPPYFNMEFLAQHGYAVLFPSTPLGPLPKDATDYFTIGFTEPRDYYAHFMDGVLTAVEKSIELGIADSNRIGLMGHSGGGYQTYGLVTQTNRFKAAVACNGAFANMISNYGTFFAEDRYTDFAHENLFMLADIEGSIDRNPPWNDFGRYLRNSPIFYVDRVQTPLLIMQGDFDSVPIQQGEEFFMSLYRQGKRAKFVRYWGEGHWNVSPANVKHYWEQVFDWFDEFLKADKPQEAPPPN